MISYIFIDPRGVQIVWLSFGKNRHCGVVCIVDHDERCVVQWEYTLSSVFINQCQLHSSFVALQIRWARIRHSMDIVNRHCIVIEVFPRMEIYKPTTRRTTTAFTIFIIIITIKPVRQTRDCEILRKIYCEHKYSALIIDRMDRTETFFSDLQNNLQLQLTCSISPLFNYWLNKQLWWSCCSSTLLLSHQKLQSEIRCGLPRDESTNCLECSVRLSSTLVAEDGWTNGGDKETPILYLPSGLTD